jgi:hypothetical protein
MADLLLVGAIRVNTVSQYVADITGDITSGSNVITNVSIGGGIVSLNELVSGLLLDNPNIPVSATITNVSGNQITISENASGSQASAGITVNCPLHKFYISDGFVYEANSYFDATAVTVGWVTYAVAGGGYQGRILKFKVSDIVYQDGAVIKCYISYDALGNLNSDFPQAATWIICQPTTKLKLASYLSAANYPELSYDGYLIETEEVRNIIDNLGVTGPQGLQGFTGVGSQGETGLAGVAGANGATGLAGTDGATGLAGVAGANGATGLAGVAGADGATGLAGVAGANGATGLAGVAGANGATGLAGADGATGLAGVAGANGATGLAGVAGANGATGLAGVAGANGATGLAGVAGANGATGLAGVAGANGATGLAGVAGANGATGLAGLQGFTGIGTNGATGLAGANGATGLAGYGVTGPQGVTGPLNASAGNVSVEVVSYQAHLDAPNGRECWIKSASAVSGSLNWTRSGTICTLTDVGHGLSNGDYVLVRNVNADYIYSIVSNVSISTFDVTVANSGGTSGSDASYVGAFALGSVTAGGLTLIPPTSTSKVADIQLISLVFTTGIRASSGSVVITLPTVAKFGGGSNNTLNSNLFTGYAVSDPVAGTSVAATGFTVSATAVTITGMTGTSSRTVRIGF